MVGATNQMGRQASEVIRLFADGPLMGRVICRRREHCATRDAEIEATRVERQTILGGKYRLIRQIGRGGMGTVYEGVHVDVGRRVAIKTLQPEVAEHPEARARFEREARAAGTIEHPNVCEVTDYGVDEDAGRPFLVMPLLRGTTLTSVIHEDAPLPVERAVDIAVQVLSALEAAHEKKLVHRDLKPDNVFLTQLGDRADVVKLLDFGITKVIGDDDSATESPLTDDGAALGTPQYMAPEQARGVSDLDGRADLFSLGATLYRMLTGERHVSGGTTSEILWNLWNEPITPARSLRPELSPTLDGVLTKAMAQDRRARYASAGEMRDALRTALLSTSNDGLTGPTLTPIALPEPAPSEAEDISEQEPRANHPRLRLFLLILGGALLVLAGVALSTLSMTTARGGEDDAPVRAARALPGPLPPSRAESVAASADGGPGRTTAPESDGSTAGADADGDTSERSARAADGPGAADSVEHRRRVRPRPQRPPRPAEDGEDHDELETIRSFGKMP